jgi:transposase
MKFLESRGVTFYFLPPYSPELNKIERVWHMMKHTWMAVKCRNSQELESDIDEILDNFGAKYKFKF